MEGPANLFRVFDVTFFVPGAVLFLDLWLVGWLDRIRGQLGCKASSDVPTQVVAAVAAVVMIYVLGVLVHGIVRCIQWCLEKESGSRQPWYRLGLSATQDGLRHYFWYMRATSWSLAAIGVPTALAIAWALKDLPSGCWPWGRGLVFGAGSTLVLFKVGRDYDAALSAISDARAAGVNSAPPPIEVG